MIDGQHRRSFVLRSRRSHIFERNTTQAASSDVVRTVQHFSSVLGLMVRPLAQTLRTLLYYGRDYTPLRLLFEHRPPCATQVVVCPQFELQQQMLHFVKSYSLWTWIEGLSWLGTGLLINESRFRSSSAAYALAHLLGLCARVLYSASWWDTRELVMRWGEILESISKGMIEGMGSHEAALH